MAPAALVVAAIETETMSVPVSLAHLGRVMTVVRGTAPLAVFRPEALARLAAAEVVLEKLEKMETQPVRVTAGMALRTACLMQSVTGSYLAATDTSLAGAVVVGGSATITLVVQVA